MTYRHSISFVALLAAALIVAAGCATTAGTNTSSESNSSNYVTVSDTAFDASGGSFALEDMRVQIEDRSFSPPRPNNLTGQLVNNTDKVWSDVNFDLVVRGPSGERRGSSEIRLYLLSPRSDSLFGSGSTVEVDESLYMLNALEDPEDPSAYSFEIENFSGDFPVNYSYSMTEPESSQELVFEDENFDIGFSVSSSRIGFQLQNKSSEPITIDWNQVSYVDPTGSSHKVMHQGVKYSNRDQSLAPTTVPPNASIEDIVLPTSNVSYNSDISEWTTDRLFPSGTGAEAYEGQSFSVFMPLEIGGETQNYNFVFNIDDVSPVTSRN